MIVDDDPNMLKLMQFYLLEDDYNIISFTKGLDALAILKKEQFDIVLIDILMPEMDGHTLLKKIREELKLEIPVVIVTAHGPNDNLMNMIDAGAYDILQKPFTKNRLKLTLRNALRHKTLTDKCNELAAKLSQD